MAGTEIEHLSLPLKAGQREHGGDDSGMLAHIGGIADVQRIGRHHVRLEVAGMELAHALVEVSSRNLAVERELLREILI